MSLMSIPGFSNSHEIFALLHYSFLSGKGESSSWQVNGLLCLLKSNVSPRVISQIDYFLVREEKV